MWTQAPPFESIPACPGNRQAEKFLRAAIFGVLLDPALVDAAAENSFSPFRGLIERD